MVGLMLQTERPAAGRRTVTSPYDGRELETLETADAAHVEDAMTTAFRLFRDRKSWLTLPNRLAILERTAELMTERVEELTVLAASEGGKPYTDSKVEVLRAIDGVKLCIEGMRAHAGDVIPVGTTAATAGRLAVTQKEPVGVVVAVSAFNHPLNLIVHQVGPAVASGCPFVVKPAEDTPLSCVRFVELLREAGLPAEWGQVVIAEDIDTAQALVSDVRVGFFSFIGSARVGWMLRSKLAPGARCALEHGGAAPVILAPPFDQDAALSSVLKGGFYHAGQVCVSVQRVYVPRDDAESFARALAERTSQLVVGPPESPDTEVGPLIRHGETERVAKWVEDAIDAGATCLTGGKTLSPSCFAPTVLLDPAEDALVSTREVFGPVVCVYGYATLDEAIDRANQLPVAFQAAAFTDDVNTALRLYKSLDASAVMINDHSAFRDDAMPFAGLRESGLGVGGIPYTLHDMQTNKMMIVKSESL